MDVISALWRKEDPESAILSARHLGHSQGNDQLKDITIQQRLFFLRLQGNFPSNWKMGRRQEGISKLCDMETWVVNSIRSWQNTEVTKYKNTILQFCQNEACGLDLTYHLHKNLNKVLLKSYHAICLYVLHMHFFVIYYDCGREQFT